jgi:hypothetical protein
MLHSGCRTSRTRRAELSERERVSLSGRVNAPARRHISPRSTSALKTSKRVKFAKRPSAYSDSDSSGFMAGG